MTDHYAYWREEMAKPGVNHRDTDRRDLCGFYRMRGAVTKPDFPVAIWMNENDTGLLLKIGRRPPLADRAEHREMRHSLCSSVTPPAA